MSMADEELATFIRDQETIRAAKAIRANIGHVRDELDRIELRLAEGISKIHHAPSGAILHLAEACGTYDAMITCTPKEKNGG